MVYLVTKARQVMLVSSSAAAPLATSVVDRMAQQGTAIPHLEVLPHLPATPTFDSYQIVVSSDRYLDDNAAGVVIFTSGTTARPKGSVLRRAYIHETASAVADAYELLPTDVLLHVLPVHHATGIGTSFFPFLNIGACIEFRASSFDAAWVWDRFRTGGITVFSGVPTIYLRLMWHYQQQIASLPSAERQSYDLGAQALRSLFCGSSALQAPVQDFWTQLRGGRPILVRYGSSEVPSCIRVPASADFAALPPGSVGLTVPGVEAKISDDGELLVKSPYMFSKLVERRR